VRPTHTVFPAAVAGRIYRDLNGRFGTPTNLQVATARDSKRQYCRNPQAALDEEDEEEATTVAAELNEASDDREQTEQRQG